MSVPVRRSARIAAKADLPKKEVFSPVIEKKVKKIRKVVDPLPPVKADPLSHLDRVILEEYVPLLESLLPKIKDITNAEFLIKELDEIFHILNKIPQIGMGGFFLADVIHSLKWSLEKIENGDPYEDSLDEEDKFSDPVFVNEDHKNAFWPMELFIDGLKRLLK
jgi:hypothetical protein